MNRIMKRMALPIGAAVVLGSAGFAYMAGATVPETVASMGSASITAANVTGTPHYTLADHGTTGTDNIITSVSFTVDKPYVSGQTLYAIIQDGNAGGAQGNYHKYGECTLTGSSPTASSYTCTHSATGPGSYGSAGLVPSTKLYVVDAQ